VIDSVALGCADAARGLTPGTTPLRRLVMFGTMTDLDVRDHVISMFGTMTDLVDVEVEVASRSRSTSMAEWQRS
jgi:hypothetical protein